jgi:hypothetical protein
VDTRGDDQGGDEAPVPPERAWKPFAGRAGRIDEEVALPERYYGSKRRVRMRWKGSCAHIVLTPPWP